VLLVACTEGGLQPRSDDHEAGGGKPPPPQGAVAFRVGVPPGRICSHTNATMSMPPNVAGVLEALTCDLTKGCKPDEFVVVDRDRGATVACSVAPSGSNFTVSAMLRVDGSSTGSESVSFGLSGVISRTGGMATINEQNSVAGGGGVDPACTVSIVSPMGAIKPGGIWGSFECQNFRNNADISETGCLLSGQFLFENCN